MRILLLGGSGQVGHELRRSLRERGELIVATRSGELQDGAPAIAADLDDRNCLASALDSVDADVVVNAAAYTAVDRAESEPEQALRINATAVRELADWCAGRHRQLVHYSTDYVFPGDGQRPYREDDPTGPLGVYGRSKLAGEEAIRASGCAHLIFRTAWVYAEHGHNFLRTMLRLGADREELRVVADQVGTPTPAALIASTTAAILAQPLQGRSGTYHLTATGQTSWAGFAEAIFDGAEARGLLPQRVRVVPITTAEYPTPARRPAYSCLDTSRTTATFGVALSDWRDGLHQTLDRLTSPS